MADDWYISSINRVDEAADHLRTALDNTVEVLEAAKRDRLAGIGLAEIVQRLVDRGGRNVRLGPTFAVRELERAVTAYRSAVIRVLVDDEHMSFSAVGDLTGVSRQMVARLYRGTGKG